MESSTANQITTPGNQNFFLSPQSPMQRQYEALRAYLLEEEPSADVARRFGYSAGAFRVLCDQFRHDPQKRASFFRQPQRGPQSSPARDRVRDLAIAMRKRNLSVYDMQRQLAAAGHTISVNSLTVLLREEGFSRLPRRADDERPATVKPEVADVADVRRLDLSPCSFRTPLAGLFLFLPLLDRIDLQAVVTAARLPSSQMIPAAQAVPEAVQFLHVDALSSRVGMKVDFDMQLTLAATSLYRMMAQRIAREYSHSQAKTVFRNLLDLSGKVEVTATSVVVTLDKRAHNPYLVASGLADQPTGMPWFGDKKLIIQFA